MFTGLIEKTGTVRTVVTGDGGTVVKIAFLPETDEFQIGESIAVNGVCLTVIAFRGDQFDVEISPETLKKSNLVNLKRGDCVNIERALKVGGRLGGHFVNGHVDGVAVIGSIKRYGDSLVFEIRADDNIMRYMVYKGSVAVNGISLTISRVLTSAFEVTVLPYTFSQTNLASAKPGDRVNIEVDIIGKYVERFVKGDRDTGLLELLGKSGYLKED
ncbi:MAG: riboflavin synthase [Deltaproteobacteria bacterium]|nr:riboflavin synthase [Deltaproteobacteria bacterium]NIS78163.1 riboflavin synthase [Deltaproteobacteria bacterium]